VSMSRFAISRRSLLQGTAGLAAAQMIRPAAARADETADVVIIGAGLSGLKTALMLEEQGLRVRVVEGRRRIGGRIFTLDDVPGHPEGGGNGIGAGYARVLDTARALKLELISVRERTETTQDESLIVLKGQKVHSKEWASSPVNPFPDALKAKMPWALQWGYLIKANPLKEAGAWRDPANAKWDISIFDFMLSQGLDEKTIALACGTGMLYGTTPYDFSTLAMFHTIAWANEQRAFGPQAYAIAGGNQRLPEAMARALKADVLLGRTVRMISATDSGTEVLLADGSRIRAKVTIITVPFTALRRVAIDPGLTGAQARAVYELGYTTAFQAHFVPSSPYWEADGLPAAMWTDGPAGRLAPLRYGKDPKQITSMLAFVNGAQGEMLDRMAPEDAARAVLAEIETVRPAAKGKLKPVKTLSWQRDPFAGGLYSSWKPGQITAFAGDIAKPAGRIHFAGEHTAMLNRGMEGAMESAERVALEVLERV